jgi:hypothetical protein
LVLDILNTEYPNNSVSIKVMRNRLEQIPPGLNDLFEMILTRDGKNLEQLHVCLKWVLFATRPLKPQEFYFAIQLGLDAGTSSYWDQEDVELNQMKTFVRTSSKGLAEVTRNKAAEVQFIHESVRNFLLDRYGGDWSDTSGNFEGHCNNTLRDCCLAQLNAPIQKSIDVPDAPSQIFATDFKTYVNLKFPFLEYSVQNILSHANSAQQYGMEQDGFLANFPLPCWVSLNNLLEIHAIRRYRDSVNPLYILAERNLAALIRIHPQKMSCFHVGDERYGPPIFAALATGSDQAVQEMLNSLHARARLPDSPMRNLWAEYHENEEKRTEFRRGFTFSPRNGILWYLQQPGDQAMLHAYLLSGQVEVNAKGANGRALLFSAVGSGCEAIVQLLIDEGAELDTIDRLAQTPLFVAVTHGHKAVVQLLLEASALVNIGNMDNRTELSEAATYGHKAIVQLLLDAGAKVNEKDNKGQTALSHAASNGHEDVIRLLLDAGAEVNIQENNR